MTKKNTSKKSITQQMDFFSPAFDKIVVEKGHAQICYPTQPFKYGYKVYWLSSKPPNFGRRHQLTNYEMSLLEHFMGGKNKFDLEKYEKEDLIALEDELTRRCNVQNTKELTWTEILVRVRRCVQADLNSKKQKEDRQIGSGEAGEPQNIEGEWSKPISKAAIMLKLGMGLRGYQKLNTFTKEHPIRKVANSRQLWYIRIDKMPKNLRDKFK